MAKRELPADRKIGRQYRLLSFERAGIDAQARTVPVAFSSEATVVERWWGNEILGHEAGEVDLSRLETGRSPVLMDHNPRDLIGVVLNPTIGSDRVGRALLRFGNSPRAEEIFRDVQDGIRSNISCGYEINELELVAAEGDPSDGDADPTYRVTKWTPFEISFVAIPADPAVGVGRSADDTDTKPATLKHKENRTMKETETSAAALASAAAAPAAAAAPDTAQIRAQVLRDRNAEAGEIIALGKRFNMIDDASAALAAGDSVDAFRKKIVDKQAERNLAAAQVTAPATHLGLSNGEIRQFSLLRAIHALGERDFARLAPFEYEASRTIADKLGRGARGFFVPYDVLVADGFMRDNPRMAQQRDMTVGTATAGGNLVATNLLAGSFIEILRNRSSVTAMGARMLPGLVGNVAIPRQTGAATAYWVAEQGNTTKSNLTVDQVTLSPKTVTGKTVVSRSLRLQSTPAADGLVRDDLTQVIALEMDAQALNGPGSSNKPTGIRNLSGIVVDAIGTNGGAITWAHLVNLESNVASANADVGALGYLTNAKQRGVAKQTVKFSNTYSPLWEDDTAAGPGWGMVNGYKARASNQVPSNLTKGTSSGVCSNWTFGNFADLIIAMWGVLDIQVDPYTGGDAGDLHIRAFQDCDINARHTTSFSIIEDAT